MNVFMCSCILSVCMPVSLSVSLYTNCKTHYYRAPFNFTHFALGDDIRSNSITMPHLSVIQLMRVFKWPRSDSDGSCVNKNMRGNKGFLQFTCTCKNAYTHAYVYT